MKKTIFLLTFILILTTLVACNASVDEKLFTPKYAAKIEFADGSHGPYYIKSQNSRVIQINYSKLPLFTDTNCTNSSGYFFSLTGTNFWMGTSLNDLMWSGTNNSLTAIRGVILPPSTIVLSKGTYVFESTNPYGNITMTVNEELVLTMEQIPN